MVDERQAHCQRFDSVNGRCETEILIIGAGITGLSTAIELAQRGHEVAVCEAQAIGAGTTAGSSAHLDAHPEMGPRQLIETLGIDAAREYTSVRLAAIDLIEERSADETDFARLTAYQYSEKIEDESSLRDDCEAACQIGLSASWCKEVPIKRAASGYQVANMARFNCQKYLDRLVAIAVDCGVKLFEKTLVSGPTDDHPNSLTAGTGEFQFEHVVCATHCNFTKADFLYAATPPYQSYILVAKVGQPPSDALFWDNSDPYDYVRRIGAESDSLILVGGCDHRTGCDAPVKASACLENWTRERFEVEAVLD